MTARVTVSQWLRLSDRPGRWHRVSLHHDARRPFRHGLTVMQREVPLDVPPDVCAGAIPDDPALCANLSGGHEVAR